MAAHPVAASAVGEGRSGGGRDARAGPHGHVLADVAQQRVQVAHGKLAQRSLQQHR